MSARNTTKIRKQIENGEFDTVLAVFPDGYGRLLGKRLTASYFLENEAFYSCDYLLSCSMDMEPQSGFQMAGWDQGYGDLVFRPDPSTLRIVSWLPGTALVMCDLLHENGAPVLQSPRSILQQQCTQLAAQGLRALIGSELEFHLFRHDYRTLQYSKYQKLEPSSPYRIDYHILSTSFEEPLIRTIRNDMNLADIPIECSKGECGAGQHEIGTYYAEALEMADRHVIYKNGAKEIAAQHNAALTFMAKYDQGQAGSSCHIHISIVDQDSGANLFWDGQSDRPSGLFRNFLGGIMVLSKEFFLFYGPNINSYKRYCSESFAPTKIAWSTDNRTAGFRIVGRGPSYRIENRMPGSDANPYLAFAAMIGAGLYGIENRIEPPDEFEGNAYGDQFLPSVPSSLSQAADLMDHSEAARSVFGDAVIDHYVQLARKEQASFDQAVTDWELQRYFERI